MKENLGTYLFLVYLDLSIASLGKGIVSFGKGLKGGSPTCLYQVCLLELNLSPQHSSPLWARVLWKPASMLKLCGGKPPDKPTGLQSGCRSGEQ